MSKGQIAAAVVGVIVLVVGFGVWSIGKELTKIPETFIVGEAFLEHLAAGNIDEATKLATSDLQSDESKAALQALVTENAPLFDSTTRVEFTGRGIQNDIRYAYGTISTSSASSFIYMEFVYEGEETKVTYFSFDENDVPKFDSDENE